uniref:START domain-containing protein n=1 Tax=Leersia perrieri TaxID=77586 RepID=A0A0D9XTA6_9ORYZ
MVAAMEKRKEIRELRDRMDRTLALPDLADEGLLRSLVKKQILASSLSGSDEGDINLIAEARSREISNFLEMLNTSENERSLKIHEAQHKEWKVKQDTDQLRVMYREGPEGTPFHTLLAEGFADGPIDVPWPVSEREALLHYFELEYLKEDLVIVIMKTISDTDNINIQTHGFSRDGIPEAGDTIRIDVVGGFVLQRITKERSFFRAIANMDIKLDFVPPWLINFISRQLIGSGHKLYQKAVSTVASCDEDYKKALREPLYVRIREHQASTDMAKVAPMEESAMEANPDNLTLQNLLAATSITSSSEIVEEESEHKVLFKLDHLAAGPSNHPAGQQQLVENKPYISPEVEQALSILDKAIGVVRGKSVGSASAVQKFLSYDTTLDGRTTDSRNSHNLPNGLPAMLPPQDSRETRQANSLPNEKANHREEDALDSDSNRYTTASTVTKTLSMTIRSTTRVHGEESLDTNGLHQNGFHKDKESKRSRKRKTNRWFCCLTPSTTG